MGRRELAVGNLNGGQYVKAAGRNRSGARMTGRDRTHPLGSWRERVLAMVGLGLGNGVVCRTFPTFAAASGDQILHSDWVQREGCQMSTEKNHARASRYRKLALAELDKEKSGLLNRIADEAEQGVLCTVDNPRITPASVKIPVA